MKNKFQKFLPGILLISAVLIIIKLLTIFNFYKWQEKRRNLFIKLLGTNLEQELDLGTVKELETAELENSLIRKLISFESSFGEEIPCYLFYHKNQVKSPSIIVAAGRGEGIVETAGLKESYQNSNALNLAKAGFVTLTCENRGEGRLQYFYNTEEREAAKSEEEKIEKIYSSTKVEKDSIQKPLTKMETEEIPEFFGVNSYLGIILEDQRRALDYLESLAFVDKKKIGATGVSLGGEISFYLAVIDKRVKGVAVMGWLTNWTELLDDIGDWRIPQIEGHFPSMADIGVLLSPRYSLFHNGSREGRIAIGIGFPADVAKLIFSDIEDYYRTVLMPSRTEFHSESVEHEFVNSLAIDFFKRTLGKNKIWWLKKDLRFLAKDFLKQTFKGLSLVF